MITPLDIKIVVVAEVIHDMSCPRSAIEDITHNMQAIDYEVVNEMADGFQKILCLTRFDDGLDDGVVIHLSVGLCFRFMEELFDDVCKLFREQRAHFRAGVFYGYCTRYFGNLHEPRFINLICIGMRFMAILQSLFRIVNHGA